MGTDDVSVNPCMLRLRRRLLVLVFVLVAAACSSGGDGQPRNSSGNPIGAERASAAPPIEDDSVSGEDILRPTGDDAPFDMNGGAVSGTTDADVRPSESSDLSAQVFSLVQTWETDWTRTSVDLGELAAGIPRLDPRDAIPPIDEPEFERTSAADDWLSPDEPGAVVELDGQARFYPLSILTRHEIVNDRFGGVPVAVTYCPLCNTALAFDRRVDGEVLRFGVSGLLRKSDLVMWDDRSTSLWQQITGQGIVGRFAGINLVVIDTSIVSFGQFAESHPDGWSLSRNTGYSIEYGANPYRGYSSGDGPIPSFFAEEVDTRFPALSRVVGVRTASGATAYPFALLEDDLVVNDVIDDRPIVVWWVPGTVDALDRTSIADSQAIGTGVAHYAETNGRTLGFVANGDGTFTDSETSSTWNVFGVAVEGELAGAQLTPLPHTNEFWFAWAGFFPDGQVYGGD